MTTLLGNDRHNLPHPLLGAYKMQSMVYQSQQYQRYDIACVKASLSMFSSCSIIHNVLHGREWFCAQHF